VHTKKETMEKQFGNLDDNLRGSKNALERLAAVVWPPSDVYTLVCGTCEYVLWHGQRDFANVIKMTGHKIQGLS
jgi:hypothetical protein